jgi:UDP-glucose 4-epimerase
MNILITGGAGFIGRNLARSLQKSNHNISILDNFSNSDKQSFSTISKNFKEVIIADITNKNDLKNLQKKYDIVIHLAAKIDVAESILNPKSTKKVNVEGTKNLLDFCKESNITRFIAISSAAVYGIQDINPIFEDNPLQPISPYGESKKEMEYEIEKFSKNHSIDAISLRLFNVYGKGQTSAYAGFITNFFECIKNEKPFTIYGGGSFTRDFISLDDVIFAIKCSMENIDDKRGNRYNIGSGNKITIKELANLILKISGKNLKIVHQPPKIGDIPYSHANIDLAQKQLGFVPKIPLEKGLEKLM